MKKLIFLLVLALAFTACKNEAKTETVSDKTNINKLDKNGKTAKQNDGLKTIVGQFIYFGDAAVLQTRSDIYGVIINDKMHELNNMAKTYKKDPTDYVTVQVRGKLLPKPEGEEGWPFRIDIKEIETVKEYKSNENDVIKLGDSKTE
ncbi:membrane lipoprotein lipid attachment site-containing protein [Psychroserpens mesophilus]|uniref:membrane lipoprotein lipid attachment site-containing protein n=1 Tax=Psychroserpens mesophilus TaxID=325473 RepID=UPI00058AEEB5|nr:membrane lipoprotein lipid attachment site-containing protein [Psychroserpens mesophilus]